MLTHCVFQKVIQENTIKIHINLDNDLNMEKGKHRKLIKQVLCVFMDENNKPISLSKDTIVHYHPLITTHDSHPYHHYTLGKKKHFFTDKKQEEEGLCKSEYVWILDFGWIIKTITDDHDLSNHMEFAFHFVHDNHFVHENKKHIDNPKMTMTMLVLYEDEEYNSDYEFGWLQTKIANIIIDDSYDIATKYILNSLKY